MSSVIFAHEAKLETIKNDKVEDECTYTTTVRDAETGTVTTYTATAPTCKEAREKALSGQGKSASASIE